MDRKFTALLVLLLLVLVERGAEWAYHAGWSAGWDAAARMYQVASSPSVNDGTVAR